MLSNIILKAWQLDDLLWLDFKESDMLQDHKGSSFVQTAGVPLCQKEWLRSHMKEKKGKNKNFNVKACHLQTSKIDCWRLQW